MEQFSKFLYDFFVAISPALQVLLQSVFAALAGVATAYVAKVYQTQKAKLSQEQQALLEIVVGKAVEAAEQVGKSGEDKLVYAFDTVEKTLVGYGVTVDVDVIYAMIEAKVFNKTAKDWLE